MALGAIGLILFLGPFFAMMGSRSSAGEMDGFIGRAFIGLMLMAVGTWLKQVGRLGVAGAGLVLDPEREREEAEPWSRRDGGILADQLDEAGIDLSGQAPGPPADLPFDEQLRRLHRLREDGVLSDSEYAEAKARVLDSLE